VTQIIYVAMELVPFVALSQEGLTIIKLAFPTSAVRQAQLSVSAFN